MLYNKIKDTLFIKIIYISIIAVSCNKSDDNGNSSDECAPNSGSFNVDVNGNNYDMIVNSETQFTILYNYSGTNETEFIIDSKDQNGNPMNIELAFPGQFNNGTTAYSNDVLDFDFFTIDVDTFNLYVSSVTFEVSESDFNSQDGTYNPVISSFTGTAHSFPWTNGQPPLNTLSISGSFCLNGIILP
ncbi:MAG: hypothetical protein IPM77_07590 [Crocinitomicaceae bacterium]|nr:hypothetical protein [Crocinitomicaceae bacterium]